MCKDNYTYSAHEDLLPCQPCRRSKCDNNEIPGGTCKHAEPDHSYCTRRATTVVDKPTVRPNQTTVRLDQTTIHLDKPTALSAKSAGLSGITIFGIVFAAVFIVCVCIYLCWHFKCKKGAPTRSRGNMSS